MIVPFSTSSLLSCDSSGNYFNLDLECKIYAFKFYIYERYYSLAFRIQSGSNTVDETDQYFEEDFTFKVSI